VKSDHRGQLVRRRTFAPGVFSVTFEAPDLARTVAPGQFVMLEVPGLIRPYLRRAYSVADADTSRGEVEFLVKTIGVGTAALEHLPEGAEARLLGPLGNVFSYADLPPGSRVAIVAGGIGAAPFPLLLRALGAARVTADVYLGGRNARELSIRDRFAGIGSGELILASDDGSLGLRGFVTRAFAERVDAGQRYARLYACGPMPMFAALAPLAAARGVPAEFSTEAAMGCGFGACLGCVIPGTEKAFIVSCTEGPILAPERIRW
jgi:dihydroorotate dehydrogenase electron transfer subunit